MCKLSIQLIVDIAKTMLLATCVTTQFTFSFSVAIADTTTIMTTHNPSIMIAKTAKTA